MGPGMIKRFTLENNYTWTHINMYIPHLKHPLPTHQCVIWTKNLPRQQDRLLIKVTRPMLLGQQTLPWRPITIAINLTCPQDRLLKNVASPSQNESVIGLEDRLLVTHCHTHTHLHTTSRGKYRSWTNGNKDNCHTRMSNAFWVLSIFAILQ